MDYGKRSIDFLEKKRVGLMYGGDSFEHEVSIMTAKSIYKNIDNDLFDVIKIFINKDGKFDCKLLKNIDVIFLAVHGPNCEDGKLQKILKKARIKYTGSGINASKLNMDKVKMHKAFKDANIPTVKYIGFKYDDDRNEIVRKIEKSIGYPCFVKPNNTGSSVGVSKANDKNELEQSVNKAFQYDQKIIVERAVDNFKDVEIGVLGNNALTISDPGEVIYDDDFYTYNAKYFDRNTAIKYGLDPLVKQKIKKMAEDAYKVTGCSGYARIDFFMDGNNHIFINEINTLPGFTESSMFPELMAKIGIGYKELVIKIIYLALE